MRTHLIAFDGSTKTMCGKEQGMLVAYGLDNFKCESKGMRCYTCVRVLLARHPDIVAQQAPELAK